MTSWISHHILHQQEASSLGPTYSTDGDPVAEQHLEGNSFPIHVLQKIHKNDSLCIHYSDCCAISLTCHLPPFCLPNKWINSFFSSCSLKLRCERSLIQFHSHQFAAYETPDMLKLSKLTSALKSIGFLGRKCVKEMLSNVMREWIFALFDRGVGATLASYSPAQSTQLCCPNFHTHSANTKPWCLSSPKWIEPNLSDTSQLANSVANAPSEVHLKYSPTAFWMLPFSIWGLHPFTLLSFKTILNS